MGSVYLTFLDDYTGNADTLGTELLESLLKMAPTKEEERKLKEYKDDTPMKLGPAEKFLKAVLDVPFAFKRVDAMLYISNFDSEVEYLKRSFQTLEVHFHFITTALCHSTSFLLYSETKTRNKVSYFFFSTFCPNLCAFVMAKPSKRAFGSLDVSFQSDYSDLKESDT